MMTLGTAIRAKRRSNSVPTSVVPSGNDASRQTKKGTSNENDSHTARRRNRVVGCRPGHCHKLLRAVSHDTQLAKREYHITTPTYDAGARARAIQNGTVWNLNGLNYRSPTGIYYNPRTGAVCPGQAAAAFF